MSVLPPGLDPELPKLAGGAAALPWSEYRPQILKTVRAVASSPCLRASRDRLEESGQIANLRALALPEMRPNWSRPDLRESSPYEGVLVSDAGKVNCVRRGLCYQEHAKSTTQQKT